MSEDQSWRDIDVGDTVTFPDDTSIGRGTVLAIDADAALVVVEVQSEIGLSRRQLPATMVTEVE